MSWQKFDFAPFAGGDVAQEQPTALERADGLHLLYPGKLHWLSGEPESLKSWLAQVVVADTLMDGSRVIYLDFETDPRSLWLRLLALGVTPEAIVSRLAYFDPSERITKESVAAVLAEAPADVLVIDGVNASMAANGYDPNKAADFYAWWGYLSRLQAATTGPTIAVDHVIKSSENRGRYASGSGQKLAEVDVHIGLDLKQEFGVGLTGRTNLILHKDRFGVLRGNATGGRLLGTLVLESDGDAIRFGIETPTGAGVGGFRPTTLMERVSRHLELTTAPRTKAEIKAAVHGNAHGKVAAIEALVASGYVAADGDGRQAGYRSLRPYRANEDPIEAESASHLTLRQAGSGRALGNRSIVPPIRGGTIGTVSVNQGQRSGNGRERSGNGSDQCPFCGRIDYEPLRDGRLRCACGVEYRRAA